MKLKIDLDNILSFEKIFDFEKLKKRELLRFYFNNLTKHHYKKCISYKKICDNQSYNPKKNYEINELPFLPVSLFKSLDLLSVKKDDISRTMHSSGTTGMKRSKIYLDKINSKNQMRALSKLFYEMMGASNRVPMLIIDNNSAQNKNYFSARAAAITGFSIFSSERTYALNEDLSVNVKIINDFLERNKDKEKIILGLTSIIWEKFILNNELLNIKADFSKTTLLHGGGWKKLEKKNISNKKFKNILKEKFNINKIVNYYGMIEQTGSIFFECEKCENFVTSVFSDIYIRDKYLNDVGPNKKGMIQLVSVLPTSYPGHNVITEDIGEIIGEDNCSCGKMGKRFKVFGRLKKSEIRGCSDAIS